MPRVHEVLEPIAAVGVYFVVIGPHGRNARMIISTAMAVRNNIRYGFT
jgi:hypothetical protein